MIPQLPSGMLPGDVLDFYDKLSGNLSDQATIHTHWWTHRQNPSVCWICDMITVLSRILDLAQDKYTKSHVDMKTVESSGLEEDSDTEIEKDISNDGEPENEPEYEVADDDLEEQL